MGTSKSDKLVDVTGTAPRSGERAPSVSELKRLERFVSAYLPKLGEVIEDRFVVRSVIGAGSFSVVYRSWDRVWRREVAVKVMKPEGIGDPEMVARFELEAEICALLKHHNTAQLWDVGVFYPPPFFEDPMPYIVFELVRGVSLGELIAVRGPLSLPETITVIVAVLDSLHEAHMHGILHRDLKPTNVMAVAPSHTWTYPNDQDGLVAGRLGIPPANRPIWKDLTGLDIKVLDFGLAKLLEIDDREVPVMTGKGLIAGTAHYMSPEQVRLQEIDYRSDIYAVAMLLHRLLVGRPPYMGQTATEVALKHAEEPLQPLPEPWTNQPIATVYTVAASKNPDDRYGSAQRMAWELRCIADPSLAAGGKPQFTDPPKVRRKGLLAKLLGR